MRSLRSKRAVRVLRACFEAGAERFGFRLIEYSIQRDHLHLIVEADSTRALSRGIQGLKIRIARGLNKLWNLTGPRFPDRYHAHVLRALREVRNALHYVLNNARHHGLRIAGIDPCSSGHDFDGWAPRRRRRPSPSTSLAHARSWILTVGWRRLGLLSPGTTPAPP